MNRTKELSYLVAGTGVFSTNVLVLDLLFMTYYSWGKYPLQVYLGKASLLAEPPPPGFGSRHSSSWWDRRVGVTALTFVPLVSRKILGT